MALVLIDSSAWVYNFGTRPVASIRRRITGLVEKNLAATTSPILFELLRGAGSGEEFSRLLHYLSSLHQFPVTEIDWLKAAQWAFRLRAKGFTAKTVDFLIAYKALRHKLTILHADRDFDRIARLVPLKVESCLRFVKRPV